MKINRCTDFTQGRGQPGGQPQNAARGFAVMVMIGVFVGRAHDL